MWRVQKAKEANFLSRFRNNKENHFPKIPLQSKFKLSLSMQKDKIIEVYSGTLWEADLLKSILESAGIDCFIKNSTLNSYAYKPIISEGAKVMILYSDMQEASKIIEDFRNSTKNEI